MNKFQKRDVRNIKILARELSDGNPKVVSYKEAKCEYRFIKLMRIGSPCEDCNNCNCYNPVARFYCREQQ